MTDHDETSHGWNDVHALSGAYAVDALDDLERARFEEHLRRCPDCRSEVQTLQETAATRAIFLPEVYTALLNSSSALLGGHGSAKQVASSMAKAA